MFRADNLVLDNHLEGSSLEKTNSPFSVVTNDLELRLGVGPCELSPIHTDMSTGGGIQVLLGPILLRFHEYSFPVLYRRCNLTTEFFWLLESPQTLGIVNWG